MRPEAECRLEDVSMEGSHAIDGVDVYSNATFTAVNCVFNNFDTPLICDSQSTVKLTNCTFSDNKVALKVGFCSKSQIYNCTLVAVKFLNVTFVVNMSFGFTYYNQLLIVNREERLNLVAV